MKKSYQDYNYKNVKIVEAAHWWLKEHCSEHNRTMTKFLSFLIFFYMDNQDLVWSKIRNDMRETKKLEKDKISELNGLLLEQHISGNLDMNTVENLIKKIKQEKQ